MSYTTPETHVVPLADFIEATRLELCERATGIMAPAYTADQHLPAAEALRRLHGRQFLSAQVDVSAALTLALRQYHSAFCIGEQGCGKSQIGLGAAALYGAQRTLILSPPHLVTNWNRNEIAKVWPGAHVIALKTLSDIDRLPSLPTPLIAILSREQAKLGYLSTPALIQRRSRGVCVKEDGTRIYPLYYACPQCGDPVLSLNQKPIATPTQAPRFCQNKHCGSSLWTAKHSSVHGGPAPRRSPLARRILETLPGFFDLLIVDELHEYQGQDTLQGEAMGHLVEACTATLGLTGTLFNGYSSSLFPILWRTHRGIQQSFPFHAHGKWVTEYGLWTRTAKTVEEVAGPPGTPPRLKVKRDARERPGASPALLVPFMDRTAFIRMRDLHQHLPPYGEEVMSIEMSPAQRTAYGELQDRLTHGIREALHQKNHKRIGLYMAALMTWPDRCWAEEPAEYHARYIEQNQPLPPVLPAGNTFPKEKVLLEMIHREKAQGRKVLVYCMHTGKRDITARLRYLAEKEGLRVDVLTSKVTPDKRLDWLDANTPHLDALICQPNLVATGLTLNDYPTIVFMEPDYAIYTLRQASRRSWRLNQTKPVKVYFMSYMLTAQERAWALVAKKLKASLLIEGDLEQAGEGLSTFQDEGDFLIELARQITESGHEKPDSLQELFKQSLELEGITQEVPAIPEPVITPVPAPLVEPVIVEMSDIPVEAPSPSSAIPEEVSMATPSAPQTNKTSKVTRATRKPTTRHKKVNSTPAAPRKRLVYEQLSLFA